MFQFITMRVYRGHFQAQIKLTDCLHLDICTWKVCMVRNESGYWAKQTDDSDSFSRWKLLKSYFTER